MPRFWNRMVDSMPREMRTLTWRMPLVVLTIILCVFIFFPYQDTPYAEKIVIDTYDVVRGSDELGKIRLDEREVVDHTVTDWWVWFTSPFHYEVEREITAKDVAPKGGRPRRERKLEVRSRGLNLGLDLRGGTELLYRILIPENAQDVTADQVKQIIQTRIDAWGLREPRIQVQGSDRLLVQLPGQEQGALDTIKGVIQNIGHLEFRLVASEDSSAYKDWKKSGSVPPDYTEYSITSLDGDKVVVNKVLVDNQVQMTGEKIASTNVHQGDRLEPEVGLSFTPAGSQEFARITRTYLKQRLAIVLNTRRNAEGAFVEKGICYSAPVIQNVIYGDATISGNFNINEAKSLRTVLMAGSLPAPLRLEHENTVGATLGPALVNKGIRAIVIGLLLVIAFMAAYYWFAGAIADFALLLNILIIVSILILFDATLTLPGIAGLLLTVGMAVDANVLIFERIREELDTSKEKPLRLAIRDGYSRAFSTIFDANVTTLFTAVILYWIGTGAVKGFGVVLAIGILTSMFTALVVTRVIFDVLVWRRLISRLPMAQIIQKPAIAFMTIRNKALLGSLVLIAAGMAIFGSRGEDNWDIDFRGGTLVHLVFNETIDADEIAKRLADSGPEFADSEVQSLAASADEGVGREAREFVVRFPALSDVSIPSVRELTGTPGGTVPVDITTVVPLPLDDVKAPLTALGGYLVTPAGQPDGENRYAAFSLKVATPTPGNTEAIRKAVEKALADKKPEGKDAVLASFTPGEPKINYLTEATAQIDSAVPLDAIQAALESDGDYWLVAPTGDENAEGRYTSFTIQSSIDSTRTVMTRIERAFATQTLTARAKSIFKGELAPDGVIPGTAADGKTPVTVNLTRPVAQKVFEDKLAADVWNIPAAVAGVPEAAVDGGFTQFAVTVASDRTDELEERLRSAPEEFPLTEPIPRVAKVGPAVAREMLIWAAVAIAAASLGIIAYVWLRFERLKYGVAAVAALVHDVLITIGALALCGVSFNLPIVAALLTIIGYSINDTIVVFDRIRENLRRQRKRDVDADIINLSINQVLSRTLLTSLTTLLAVLSLLLFGGGVIGDFALALLFGVFVGTYSSIFIASPLLILHQEQVEKRLRRT